MKVQSIVLALAIGGVAAGSAVAKEWHVYSAETEGMTGTQQLTNAFTCAQSGDTITIHAGTYNVPTEEMTFRYETSATVGSYHATRGTCLYSTAKNLTIQGDPDVGRDEVVLSGLGSNAASSDGHHAILRLDSSGCVVKHLTFYKGWANYDAIVYRNGKKLNTDKWIFRRGGGIVLGSRDSLVEDCTFKECFAGQGAATYGGGTIRGCLFSENGAVSYNSGCAVCDIYSIYDSTFDKNSRGALRGCATIASNCVFTANYNWLQTGLLLYHTGALVDCVFSNNTATCLYMHGAGYMPKEITRCTFYGNTPTQHCPAFAAGIGGSVPCTTPIKDCVFAGPLQLSNCTAKVSGCTFYGTSSRGIIAACPNVVDSRLVGQNAKLEGAAGAETPACYNCGFTRCTFDDLRLYNAYGFKDVTLTNCLVTRFVQWGGGALFAQMNGMDMTYCNCTVVSNGPLNAMFDVANLSGHITFKNTLFCRNKVSGQEWGKFDFYDTYPTNLEVLAFDHSIFKAGNNGAKANIPCVGCENLLWKTVAPRFVMDGYRSELHKEPYALTRRSPYKDMGDNGTWTAQDTDLAGNLRVNGIVDIGCYENWDVAPGCMVIVR